MTLRSGFTLGDWAVHPLEGRLNRAEEHRRVQPKSMEVLLCLAEAEGEVVERDTLLRQVWGEHAVSDEPLTRCIGELRRALGDKRAEPEYILTIPKRGYRLLRAAVPLAKAAPTGEVENRPTSTAEQKAPLPRSGKRLVAVLGSIAAVIATFAVMNAFLGRPAEVERPDVFDSAIATRSIAVLPFADMSANGDQEYLSDGIAEELLNLLARIQDLRVISRTSAFSFKGKSVDVREIADRLDVAYVLEGSVRTSEDRIRVTTQLIDARTDTHIWSASYDRELEDIFSIQDEIAAAVVNKLELTLLNDAPKTRETNPEAYSLFLQARYLHEHPAGDSFQRAFKYYKAALDVDENYVPAWVWLAALYDDTVNSSGLPYEEVGRLIRNAIEKALAISPDDPLALGMSGVLVDAWDNDPVTAAARMQRALELDPNNPILLRWAAILLNSLGRHQEALGVTEYLFEQDPLGGISKVNLAETYLMAGRFDDAIRICEIQDALSSEGGPCRSRLIVANLYAGDAGSAYGVLEQVTGSRVYLRLAPMVFHSLGRQAEFEVALAELQKGYEDGDKGLAYWLARTHTFTGDTDTAMSWYERAADEGVLKLSPNTFYYADVRSDPRWSALMERIGRTADGLQAIELVVAIPRS